MSKINDFCFLETLNAYPYKVWRGIAFAWAIKRNKRLF